MWAQFDETNIRFPFPNGSNSEIIKQEQMNLFMPELKAQLHMEGFGLRKVGADLVALRFKEG